MVGGISPIVYHGAVLAKNHAPGDENYIKTITEESFVLSSHQSKDYDKNSVRAHESYAELDDRFAD